MSGRAVATWACWLMKAEPNDQTNGSRIEDSRIFNRRLVFETIFQRGPISRVEIGGVVGLKPQTISSITRELLDQGLIAEAGRSTGLRGQPQTYLEPNARAGFSVGVHLDQGLFRLKVYDLKRTELVRHDVRCDTSDPEESLRRVAAELLTALDEIGADVARVWGIGVVLPTFGDPDCDFDYGMPEWGRWNTVSVAEMLGGFTGLPVFVENDATAAAIGERFDRPAGHATDFCYIYIGNGTGAGFIVDGMPFKGAHGNSGEVGLLPVFGVDGSMVWPDRNNEDILSWNGLIAACADPGQPAPGLAQDMPDLDRLVRQRDHRLMAWVAQGARSLRDITAVIELLFAPEMIVVGGMLPRSVVELLVEHAYPLRSTPAARRDRSTPRLAPAALIEDAAVTGAAMLPIFVNTNPNFRHLYVRQITQDSRPPDAAAPQTMPPSDR